MKKTGIELITEERQRQIEVEGWNDESPKDCGGCSCVKIHDKITKEYFENNEMCDLYVPIAVDDELESKIHEEAHRGVLYCTDCGALEFFDCVCNEDDYGDYYY